MARQTKVCELEIYDLRQTKYEFKEEELTSFRQFVSKFRQGVWNFTESTKRKLNPFGTTYQDASQKLENVKTKTIDTVDYVQNDPGLLPRAGVITIAGLGGLVAGYKRGNLRKAFYSGSAMLVAASLCYPNQAVDITRNTFNRTRDFAYEQYTGEKSPPREESDGTSSGLGSIVPASWSDNLKAMSDKIQGKTPTTASVVIETPVEGTQEVAGDFGQSSEEDKDLYTTRDG